MATYSLSPLFNGWQGFDAAGNPLAAGTITVYLAGTSTLTTTWTTSTAAVQNSNPIVLNGGGYPPNQIWLDDIIPVKFVVSNASGSETRTYDNVSALGSASDTLTAALADTSSTSNGDALIGVKTTSTGAVATTQHQVNEEDDSVFRFMTSAQIAAIQAETGLSGAVCSTALQAALDGVRAGANLGLNRYPVGTYQLDVPLRVKNGTNRINLRGDHRIRSILQPNAIDIKAAPVNVNALFINQDNNPHFGLRDLRLTSAVAYTGVGIYAVEGGGSDASGQCVFSGLFQNLWVDFSSTNTGFLTGATQNSVFDTVTCEFMKGIFNLQGAGNGDNFYRNFTLSSCYDQFILQTTDTQGSFQLTVDGLHVYTHYRGLLFDVQNWTGSSISNVSVESQSAAVNADGIGVGRFKNCAGLQIINVYGLTRAGVPALSTGLEFEGCTGVEVVNALIIATNPARINGTSAVDISFVNCDFSTAGDSCLVIAAALVGTLRTRGCKFNNAQLRCMVNTVGGSSFSWYSYGDEFINAGLGGNAASRNLDIATSGAVKLYNPRIGQNNGSAAAAYYVAGTGSGTVDIYDPEWIGTPPTGLIDPASTMVITVHKTPASGFTTQTAATYTVLESDRDLTANRAGTVTYTLPTPSSANVGLRLNIRTIQNQTAVSASANVVPLAGGAAGAAILAATAGRWAELVSNGSAWQIVAAG